MKNTIVKTSLLVLIAGILTGPAASLAQSPAARRAVDFRMTHSYDPDDKSVPTLDAQAKKGKVSQMGDVHEEKNTSPSPNKMQTDPYHRTVSTGLSF
jgi:hypothetical protein